MGNNIRNKNYPSIEYSCVGPVFIYISDLAFGVGGVITGEILKWQSPTLHVKVRLYSDC